MRKGFTLIELICVISIISILAGTILPVVGEIMDQVRDARAATEVKHLGLACVQYENANGYLPGSARGGRSSWCACNRSNLNLLNNEVSRFLSKTLVADPFGMDYRYWFNLTWDAQGRVKAAVGSSGRNRVWNNWNASNWRVRSFPADDHIYIFK
jgi:prepilin-type N-terminal cleavage/methylation domain-containing protein